MKAHLAPFFLGFLIVAFIFQSCEKDPGNDIIYQKINKSYILSGNIHALRERNDEIFQHVDSILSGLIQTQFISTGYKKIFLDPNRTPDIAFEIIDLHKFNPPHFPKTFDSLAARVIPLHVDILDNSGYGYPDALSLGETISGKGNWVKNRGVLGTFLNAGKFQGKGLRYLGIRLQENQNKYHYGWIRIYCSRHSDTLRIIDYAYNTHPNQKIWAGQER